MVSTLLSFFRKKLRVFETTFAAYRSVTAGMTATAVSTLLSFLGGSTEFRDQLPTGIDLLPPGSPPYPASRHSTPDARSSNANAVA